MSRKGTKVQQSNNNDGRYRKVGSGNDNFKGYVQHSLTTEEKAAFDEWEFSEEEMWALIEVLVDSAYKISLSYDGYNQTFQCSLTCNSSASDNQGWVLVARAPDCYNALRLVLFKHHVLLAGDWSAFQERDKSGRQWG